MLELIKAKWLFAGMAQHFLVLLSLFRIFGNGFDSLFDLAWANGIDGPSPLLDFLVWTVRIGLPTGFVFYAISIKDFLYRGNAQLKDQPNPHTSGPVV